MFRIALLVGVLALFVLPAVAQSDRASDRPNDRRVRITKHLRVVVPEEAKGKIAKWVIKLAVTFLDDGTIGEVRCVNDDNEETRNLVKYGVVQAAIDGAKKIEFEPEIKDGTAITVTKMVEYSYTTY